MAKVDLSNVKFNKKEFEKLVYIHDVLNLYINTKY